MQVRCQCAAAHTHAQRAAQNFWRTSGRPGPHNLTAGADLVLCSDPRHAPLVAERRVLMTQQGLETHIAPSVIPSSSYKNADFGTDCADFRADMRGITLHTPQAFCRSEPLQFSSLRVARMSDRSVPSDGRPEYVSVCLSLSVRLCLYLQVCLSYLCVCRALSCRCVCRYQRTHARARASTHPHTFRCMYA